MHTSIRRDLRHAVRSLAASRTYFSVSVVTLALVIGAASAVVAVVNATMIRPFGYPAEERLVQIFLMPPGATAVTQRNPLSPRRFLRFRGRLTQVERVEGFWARNRALGGDGEPESVAAASVSAGALELFGGRPPIGRMFSEEDDRTNARVVVLSHALWQRRFGGDTAIVGRTVLIDREPFEVIGIMAPGFRSGSIQSELWTPLNVTEAAVSNTSTFIQTFARLAPGATVAQFRQEIAGAMNAVTAEAPKTLSGWTPAVTPLREAQFGQQRDAIVALFAAVVTLVLIACANLANLTLARVAARRTEFAVRAAVGGTARDLVRLQAIETSIVGAAGVGAGLLCGMWLLPALLALDPALARLLGDARVDWRVQAAVAIPALAMVLIAGVLPIVIGRRDEVAGVLRSAGTRTIGSRSDRRLRRVLVGAESAMAVILIVAGALLLSGLRRAAATDPGFDPSGVLTAQMRISASAYPNEASRAEFITRVLDRVRAIPGVTAAGATLNPFIPGFTFQTLVHIEGKPTPDGQPHTVLFRRASPGYFAAMRIPLVSGRDFDAHDSLTSMPVAVVSRAFAERFWPGEDPIGRRMTRGASPKMLTVVGVVADVSDAGFGQAPAATVYITFGQNNVAVTPVSLVVRTGGDAMSLAPALNAAVRSVDPAQPLDNVATLDRFLADSLGPQRFRSALLMVFAAIGLAIAAAGIYGVTSRAVQEQTAELGLRLALGATRGSVIRTVGSHALNAVIAGFGAGALVGAVVVITLIRTLPGLRGADAWSAAPAVLVLGTIALLAALVPARRAAALDPAAALRTQ